MSKLDELIKKYCPDGVEYKKLGDIATISRGGNFQKKDYVSTGVPCIHYGQLYVHYNLFTDNVITYIHKDKAVKQKFAEPNDIIMAVTSENIEDVCKSIAWLGEEKVAVSGHSAIIHHSMNPKYLAYYLNSLHFYKQKVKLAHGTKVIEVTPSALNEVSLPVPPLPVQEEIVRILDSFTSLTAELQDKLNTEFQARKKQYEYYASNLFDKASIEWKSMGDIASFVYGYTDKAQDTGDTRFIRITDIDEQGHLKNEEPKYITINNEAKKSLLSYGDLIMARTGATYGKTLYFESEFPSVYASFLIKIIPNKNIILNKYYWHFTRTSFYWEQANRLVTTGGQPQFNTPAIKQIKIPVPSIDVQKQIINILDKFDSLINDLTTGLPAEIAARQKQYKYYRDKLLTFKELS